jgi:hypothetical protein
MTHIFEKGTAATTAKTGEKFDFTKAHGRTTHEYGNTDYPGFALGSTLLREHEHFLLNMSNAS